MKFVVSTHVFKKLESVCFGVVVARGIDNRFSNPKIAEFLQESIRSTEEKFADGPVKESPAIIPYREAFTKLGINPNKFMCSIEALTTRIAKKKGFPEINAVVDLGNAIALKYLLPLGAHDIGGLTEDIEVRFAGGEERFIPFGQEEAERPVPGELVYAVGNQVKTRLWIWRQSELGKVTERSTAIFFPIDGFTDVNLEAVIKARDELALNLQKHFGCSVSVGLVDRNKQELDLSS